MQSREIIALAFLGLNTYSDVKTSRVMLWSAIAFGIAGVVRWVLVADCSLVTLLLSLIPGILLLGISKMTRESLGYGDDIVILVLGLYIRLEQLIWILLVALMLAAVWAGIMLAIKRKNKQQAFPFLPFLLIAFVGGIW